MRFSLISAATSYVIIAALNLKRTIYTLFLLVSWVTLLQNYHYNSVVILQYLTNNGYLWKRCYHKCWNYILYINSLIINIALKICSLIDWINIWKVEWSKYAVSIYYKFLLCKAGILCCGDVEVLFANTKRHTYILRKRPLEVLFVVADGNCIENKGGNRNCEWLCLLQKSVKLV